MKHYKTSNSLPVAAGILGAVLATTPIAKSASISPEEALEEVFAAEITGLGSWTDRVYAKQSWLKFEGMEGFTYEVHVQTGEDAWVLLGTAEVNDGQGIFAIDAGHTDPDDFEVRLTLYGESAPPNWPAGSAFTIVSAGPDGVEVAWEKATDDLDVAGYAVYVNGEPFATMGPAVCGIVVEGLEPGQAAEIDLLALDAQGQVAQHPDTLFTGNIDPVEPTALTYKMKDLIVTSYKGIVDPSGHAEAANLSGKNLDRPTPLITASAYLDVNGDGTISPLDALRVAAQAGLSTGSRWDDTDVVHVVAPGRGLPSDGSVLGLVGLPTGIGLTFQAPDPGPLETGDVALGFRAYSLPVIVYVTLNTVTRPHLDGLVVRFTGTDEEEE